MSNYNIRKTPGDTSWFMKDRFGMFIHFGLYSVAGRHEWVKYRECIPEEKYQKYFEHFDPDLLDIREWAKQAKAAGMKYAVLTTKHHEGFCLFDSKYTDYKSTNTPCGRDIVREYVDAFRAEGIRIGLYYSLIDWHHPDFTIDIFHPRRKDANVFEENKKRDQKKYCEYMRNQLTELLQNYGKIDVLFLDDSYNDPQWDALIPPENPFLRGKGREDWEAEKLIETIRSIQPNIIINNRTQIEQDLWTPEQYMPISWPTHPETRELVPWEGCHTFSGSWGYYRDEMTWKTPDILINLLIRHVALGGNMIMNIGPCGRGYIDSRAEAALKVYADWMKYHNRSIYGCTMAAPEFKAPNGCCLTQSQDGKRLYIHILEYPVNFLCMENMAGKIEYAQFLHDGSEVMVETTIDDLGPNVSLGANAVAFRTPDVKPNTVVPVIEVFLKD